MENGRWLSPSSSSMSLASWRPPRPPDRIYLWGINSSWCVPYTFSNLFSISITLFFASLSFRNNCQLILHDTNLRACHVLFFPNIEWHIKNYWRSISNSFNCDINYCHKLLRYPVRISLECLSSFGYNHHHRLEELL